MANEWDDTDLEIEDVQENVSSEPPPPGTYLCRLEVGDLSTIGSTKGWKVYGRVVETNYRGRLVEDVLYFTDAAKSRLVLAMHRIGGMEKGVDGRWPSFKARDVVRLLDGQLARMTVERVIYQRKGDKTEFSEAKAIEMRANGEKMYGHTRVPFAGYETPTAEEIDMYAENNIDALLFDEGKDKEPAAPANGPVKSGKLPF